jgi:hypothetical protein
VSPIGGKLGGKLPQWNILNIDSAYIKSKFMIDRRFLPSRLYPIDVVFVRYVSRKLVKTAESIINVSCDPAKEEKSQGS